MSVHDFKMRSDAPDDSPCISEALIRRLQKARKSRSNFFGEDLFADPAWDLLLELYANKLGQQRTSLSQASNASGVPMSTALRWMVALEQRDLVVREKDPLDARRAWLSLTPLGASLMHRYFMRIATAA